MTDILIIMDAHLKPGADNSRFAHAGRLIADRQPEVIVEIGDGADMPSLSDYDVGKHVFEGRRYKEDVKALRDGYAKLEAELPKKGYKPHKFKLWGNHEERILRVLNRDPKLIGTIGLEDFGLSQWGWSSPRYLEPVEINGVFFSHYFVSGVMGRPIGGENPATALCNKMHRSCVAGHLHLFDYSERTDVAGSKIQCMVGGCFLAEDQVEEYSGEAQKMWHNGLVYLHDVRGGRYDFETISTERLRRTYG